MNEPYVSIALTDEQMHKWKQTLSLLTIVAPGYAYILYTMLSKHNPHAGLAFFTKDIPVAATDGECCMINPDTYFEYTLPQRVYILGHEINHNIFDDVRFLHQCVSSGTVPMNDGSTLPFDMQTIQHAADYRINPVLTDSRIGAQPPDALFDADIATANTSLLDAYQKLYKNKPPGQGQGDGGKQGFDTILPPGAAQGKQPDQAARQRNQRQWEIEMKEARRLQEQAYKQGSVPGSLVQMFKDILEPNVPWTDLIQAQVHRIVGIGGYDWRKADRRFIDRGLYMPSRSGFTAGWLVCWADNSGSMIGEIERYLGELGAMMDLKPKRLTVVWNDAAIQAIDELMDDWTALQSIQAKGRPGGGGTSIMPVLQWIETQHERPDMFIGFTDGYFTMPNPPRYPVTWACTTNHEFEWGMVTRIRDRPKHA